MLEIMETWPHLSTNDFERRCNGKRDCDELWPMI